MIYTATIQSAITGKRSPVILADYSDFYKVITGCQRLSMPREFIRVYEEPKHDLCYFEYVLDRQQ